MQLQPLGWEDHLERGLATHSSVLAWRIPWTKKLGRLEATGLQRLGHDFETEQQQQKQPWTISLFWVLMGFKMYHRKKSLGLP